MIKSVAATSLDVRFVTLEPMRVASTWGFGASPERIASDKMLAWAGARGLLEGAKPPRIFGFNNPNPSEGSANYGYEFWIAVEPDLTPDGDIRLGDFKGGRYAVLPLEKIEDPAVDIPAGWHRLHAWITEHGYRMGEHHWLEEHDAQCRPIALYYPLAE